MWGAVSLRHGCSRCVISNHAVDGAYYRRILRKSLKREFGPKFQDGTLWFQQDNAKPHKSVETMDKLKASWGWNVVDWPPSSCDFSPIELVWAMMVAELDTVWKPRNAAPVGHSPRVGPLHHA